MSTIQAKETAHDFQVGEFLSEFLVTDTTVYEVMRTTAKTITLRSTRKGETMDTDGLVVYSAVVPDPEGRVFTLRVRKDGCFRRHNRGGRIKRAKTIDGIPVKRTDYGF